MTVTAPARPESLRLLVAKRLLDAALIDAHVSLAKIATPQAETIRARFLAEAGPGLEADLAAYFVAFGERVLPVVKADIEWKPDAIDWSTEEAALLQTLRPWYQRAGEAAFRAESTRLGIELTFDLAGPSASELRRQLAIRVTAISDVSRQALRRVLVTAIERGYSPGQLLRGVPGDGFAGLQALVAGWSSTPAGGAASRAALIARTETATAYNLGSAAAYRASGLVSQVEIFDGIGCGWISHDDPDIAAGSIRSLSDAEAYPISHPNCQRSWAPYFEGS